MTQHTDPDDLEDLLAISVVEGMIHLKPDIGPNQWTKCTCGSCVAVQRVCELAKQQVEQHRAAVNRAQIKL